MGLKSLAIWALAACLLAAPSLAQPGPGSASAAPPAPALSAVDLEAWLDGFMPYALRRGDVAGAVVVVVKDGQVLLAKGYGYADVKTRRPVDPETTLFRPGSVTKLITWTAVMQQVELGRIDLDRDVNTYLDFRIPPFHGAPVTMRNLMTHTGGFEDSLKNILSDDPPPPLGAFLKSRIPARVFAPGKVPAYSNYGASLAGYIVQRVSGEPFDAYVERHVFAPLGISHASMRQPLPAALRPAMSSGYARASEPAKAFEMLGLAPAGSASISGADMARFMIAHLQDGAFEGKRIMGPQTARAMHDTPLTTVSPALDRMLLGFYEMDRNGRRIIGHEGDSRLFHSALELYPDDHVGLFLSLNSLGSDNAAYAIRTGLEEGFADRYFPGPAPKGAVAPEIARRDAKAIAGVYDGSRREQTGFLSLGYLLMQAKVTADADGRITASPAIGLDGEAKQLEEIAPFAWRAVGGQERLAARVVGGKVVMWSDDEDSPSTVYTRTPWPRDGRWLVPALGASVGALLLTAVLWPVSALVRRRYGASFPLLGQAARSYRWVRIGAAAASLLMLAWLATIGAMAAAFYFSSKLDPWILALHLSSIAVFPIAAAVGLWNLWIVWTTRRGWRGAFARVWSLILASSCLILLWVALDFHLIGLGFAF
jgi:CubicO group peptidase (beta-lactamase class C family)